MGSFDTINTLLQAWSVGDTATLGAQVTDDFVFSGPVPQPIGKAEFLTLCGANHAAFSDWDFHARDFREAGDTVYLNVEITAKHTGDLAIIPLVSPVPATGKQIHLPEEHFTVTMQAGKVKRLDIQVQPDGGYVGAYAQVGAPLPAMG